MADAKSKAGRPRRLPSGVRLEPLNRAAERVGVSIDTFELNYLGAVFTEFRPRPGGWRKVFGDEVDLFLDHTDEATAAAAVAAYRRAMGRL